MLAKAGTKPGGDCIKEERLGRRVGQQSVGCGRHESRRWVLVLLFLAVLVTEKKLRSLGRTLLLLLVQE